MNPVFFSVITQIWRRSRVTLTPSGSELPHMAVEALVRNTWLGTELWYDQFVGTLYRHCLCEEVSSCFKWPRLKTYNILSSRSGESVHVVPGAPQCAPDLNVPTWPQASDTLNLQLCRQTGPQQTKRQIFGDGEQCNWGSAREYKKKKK